MEVQEAGKQHEQRALAQVFIDFHGESWVDAEQLAANLVDSIESEVIQVVNDQRLFVYVLVQKNQLDEGDSLLKEHRNRPHDG